MSVIQVEGLHKSYKSVRALDDVSFTVQRGEVFALLGPNGAGKTTCIEILEGFHHRDGGNVDVLGFDPGARAQQEELRTRIGVVLQELAVESFFTVRQVLTRNAGFYRTPRPVDEVIELVGLGEKADEKVKRLSGGQQRRLDIGLGIIGRPELLFLDEPTTGLDPGARRTTWDLIRTLAEEGATVLLSSHYMDEVEALAQRVIVISKGRIVASGAPASLGGRDRGRALIRFTLPTDVTREHLPFAVSRRDGATVEIDTDDEVVTLHQLTTWALEHTVNITGLTVKRQSLEDVYIALTAPDTSALSEVER